MDQIHFVSWGVAPNQAWTFTFPGPNVRRLTETLKNMEGKLYLKQQKFGVTLIEGTSDDKFNVAEIMSFGYERVQNTLGKGDKKKKPSRVVTLEFFFSTMTKTQKHLCL